MPYSCYYHVYDREGLYRCAAETKTDWILTMGDSQEREFVAVMKNINGSTEDATKFEDVRAVDCIVPACCGCLWWICLAFLRIVVL